MRRLSAACLIACGVGLPDPGYAQLPAVSGSPAVADTITDLLSGIAAATSALEVDRLLGFYQQSDALMYVAQGRVTRSFDAFARVVRAQLGGLTDAELVWHDRYIDVLGPDVALATATYELSARVASGASVRTTGTYLCVFVRTSEGWRVRYSAHSFPRQP